MLQDVPVELILTSGHGFFNTTRIRKHRRRASRMLKIDGSKLTHTNGSKSLPRRKVEEERKRGRPMSRGELWPLTHKRKDSTYMNEAAKLISEQIERIESQDGVSKKISEFDSLTQVLGKEHAGRVRGVGYGPTPTQVFGQTSYQFNGVYSTQANRDHEMEELKLKMQELQSVVESERSRRRALENFLTRYIVQQGMELPAELADMGSAAAVCFTFSLCLYLTLCL
ncbi:uncharacterized protein LOC132638411 isoform X1 [Lycium barbarum]|uniref:uncharacterized protein LOC132638411 isoform X1 n=1 Tax=Lycium barbarum TaxID=112863 RepID=UPI00293F60FB|nr:uncharacterized protein LOC132638411 isoform X1 [Lycium barbarum]